MVSVVKIQLMIVDFTGGNKPMSVGAVLACTQPERRLEYLTQVEEPIPEEIKISYKLRPIKR